MQKISAGVSSHGRPNLATTESGVQANSACVTITMPNHLFKRRHSPASAASWFRLLYAKRHPNGLASKYYLSWLPSGLHSSDARGYT
ncbi:hypothetical protein HAX54_009310 [Datura stramonium]|uniref:Uncharacterized protein n=1 Tax=Datura stramonium TaxID=4076 RepID=A0ABS8TFF7_DATST|nr:hypothetical protein [Datura stramonium]